MRSNRDKSGDKFLTKNTYCTILNNITAMALWTYCLRRLVLLTHADVEHDSQLIQIIDTVFLTAGRVGIIKEGVF